MPALRQCMRAIDQERRRFGYRRLRVLLNREVCDQINRKSCCGSIGKRTLRCVAYPNERMHGGRRLNQIVKGRSTVTGFDHLFLPTCVLRISSRYFLNKRGSCHTIGGTNGFTRSSARRRRTSFGRILNIVV